MFVVKIKEKEYWHSLVSLQDAEGRGPRPFPPCTEVECASFSTFKDEPRFLIRDRRHGIINPQRRTGKLWKNERDGGESYEKIRARRDRARERTTNDRCARTNEAATHPSLGYRRSIASPWRTRKARHNLELNIVPRTNCSPAN